ncbi:LON peptidase substrate-binding domain-containing protein [Aurantivibrio infirmus]
MKAEAKTKKFINDGNAQARRLPLFPLGTSLFPGVTMALQIFEPRYLNMIARQLKREESFGLVTIKEGAEVGKAPSIYPFGVEVEIVDWYQQSNQLLGIKVCGKRVFEVIDQEIESDQLMMGTIKELKADGPEPIPADHDGLQNLLEELKRHPALAEMDLPEPSTAGQLSSQLAQLLPLSTPVKMTAMQIDNSIQRLDFLAEQIRLLAEA